MTYVFMRFFSKLICLCPHSLRRRIGNLIGSFTWAIVPAKRKQMAVCNIILSLPQAEQEAPLIAKSSWTRFGKMIVEVMAFPEIKQNIDQYTHIEGSEHMDKALSFGNGVVMATAHSGNWEMLGAALSLHGYPMVAVAQKQTNADMDRLINEYRTIVGMHVTYKSSVREMIRLLGQGNIIGMVMDQDAGSDGVRIDFFGRPASCPQGPAFLARFKNAPIVPAFITEDTNGHHTILLKEPIWAEHTEDKQADIKNTTEKLTKMIEDHIRKYPAEWFWLHDRWKYTRNNP